MHASLVCIHTYNTHSSTYTPHQPSQEATSRMLSSYLLPNAPSSFPPTCDFRSCDLTTQSHNPHRSPSTVSTRLLT